MFSNCSEEIRPIYPIPTAAAMILNPVDEILLLKSVKWKGLFGFPGGKIQYGEGIEDALVREIREETGLIVYDPRFFVVQELISEVEFIQEKHFISLNYICHSHTSDVVLNEEASDYLWCSPREALTRAINRPTRAMIEYYLATGVKGNMAAIENVRIL